MRRDRLHRLGRYLTFFISVMLQLSVAGDATTNGASPHPTAAMAKCDPRQSPSLCTTKSEQSNGHADASDRTSESDAKSKKDEARSVTAGERTIQDRIFWFVTGLIFGLVLYRLLRFWSERFRKDLPRAEWPWIAIALAGAAGHAVFVGTKVGDQWEPAFDTTTLLWLGAAAAGLLYPRISEITLGTFGIKLIDVVSEANDLVVSAFGISEKWGNRLNVALVELPPKPDAEVAQDVITLLKEAAKDATDWLGKDGDARRLAFWIYDHNADQIGFFFSNEINPQSDPAICNFYFKRSEGLIGQGLVASAPINIANAQKTRGFVQITGDHGSSAVRGLYRRRSLPA